VEADINPDTERERIMEILARAPEILTLPSIINEIMDVISRKNSSATDLTNIIESDPALTTRILTVANSAYYGFVKKISTISHAVVVLGFKEIQNIALGMSVLQMFNRKGSEFSEQLWRHSFSVGVGTRMIAQYLNLKIDGKYFVGGLLHDVGKIFISQYLTDTFSRLLDAIDDDGNNHGYHTVEEKIFGITHAEVGQILLNSWMFPPDIVNTVAHHHTPVLSDVDPIFTVCVHLADVLCTAKGITPLKDRHFIAVDRDILSIIQERRHHFSTEDIVSLMSQLDIEIERQGSFMTAFKRN
jgi:putative nucleotidyltransferase with HDIG domain